MPNAAARDDLSGPISDEPPAAPVVEAREPEAVDLPSAQARATEVLALRVYEHCDDDRACLDRAGVHYEIPGASWGPQGLYVDEAGRFWVCDSPAGRLVAFDAKGKVVGRVPYEHVGLGHLLGFAVTSSYVWLVGTGEQADKPLELRASSHDGKTVVSTRVDAGETLMVPERPDVFLYGGLRKAGVVVPRVSDGAIVLDPATRTVPFVLGCDSEHERGQLETSASSVSFDGCVNPLRIGADGSLDAYRALGGDRRVARFASDGTPVAAVFPPAPGYHIDIGFAHAAAGPKGELYAVVPELKVFKIVELGMPTLAR